MIGDQVVKYGAIAAAALLSVGLVAQTVRLSGERLASSGLRTQLEAERRGRSDDRAAGEAAARTSSENERETERLRRQAMQRITDEERQRSARLALDADGLRLVAGQLRDDVDRYAAAAAAGGDQGSGDPAAVGRGQAAAGAGLVLAELYRGADGEAVELAIAYDRARRAGLACERGYSALKPAP